ncbi:Nif11-like leader peptide family natural product precursor [Scytonema sp. PCC 10023]|uniref:Nif11-type n=1 Tax=Scytonema sp. PCC 10023 TaxID=1680591 RepID=A0A2P0ZGV7_9CYAN|nr:Nif11-type precursor [Scytonema sp. PCC 10023]
MSIESARAFYDRIVTDEAFKTQYQSAASDDERREIVLAAGYNFTPQEWEAAMTQISQSSNEELSDAELTAVSGGSIRPLPGWPPKWPTPVYGTPRL